MCSDFTPNPPPPPTLEERVESLETRADELAARLETLEGDVNKRLNALERHSHKPFDFTDLMRRLTALEDKR